MFSDVSALLGPKQIRPYEALAQTNEGYNGLAWFDFDNDGDLDLFVCSGAATGSTASALFRNDGDGNFTDVTAAAFNVAADSTFGGFGAVVAGDIDNDGFVDLYLTAATSLVFRLDPVVQNALFHNLGDGTFEDITQASGAVAPESPFSASMADIDNDGYLDIFITASGRAALYDDMGVLIIENESYGNILYRNKGDLTFEDVTESAGVSGLYVNQFNETVSDGECVSSFFDYDLDGDQDLLVGNCHGFHSDQTPLEERGGLFPFRLTPFNLYRNNGDGTFTDVAEAAGLAGDGNLGFWMSIAIGDINGDGFLDFWSSNGGVAIGAPHKLYQNNGDGTFTDVRAERGFPDDLEWGWGATLQDFDNDGDLDVFFVGALPLLGLIGPGLASPGSLFLQQDDGTFANATGLTGIDLSSSFSSGLASGDFDGDGFQDLAVMVAGYDGPPVGYPLDGAIDNVVLLKNLGNGNNYITVRLTGTASNSDGIGARVYVRSAGNSTKEQVREVIAGTSMGSSHQLWPTFGLGSVDKVDIEVRWPTGLEELFTNIAANQVFEIVETNPNPPAVPTTPEPTPAPSDAQPSSATAMSTFKAFAATVMVLLL
jgi:hypothetical protein